MGSNGSIFVGFIALLVLTFALITIVTGGFGQWLWLPLVVIVLARAATTIR